jgi:serine protease Do
MVLLLRASEKPWLSCLALEYFMKFANRRFATVLPLLALFAFSAAAQAQTQTPDTMPAPKSAIGAADAVQEAFVSVASRLKPSVVTIYCERSAKAAAKPGAAPDKSTPDDGDDDDDAPADPSEPQASLGTGMVVGADGLILTNYHVVKGADVVRVMFNADSEDADKVLGTVVGYDEESDLAVIKVNRTGLTPVVFANSDDVRIGQWAMAIGAPFDEPMTVTVGVISAKSRHLDKKGRVGLQDYLQTDASINPGNSGGPLIDLQGRVIGVNTAILSPSRFNVGIGFSVPSNGVKRVLPTLLKGQSIRRGFLGIQYVRLDPQVAHAFGVAGGMQIGALAKKDGVYIGPARAAGLREDDIITGINDEPVTSSDQFRNIVSNTPPGGVLKFEVTRPSTGEQKLNIKVTLGDWNSQFAPAPKVTPVNEPTAPAVGLGLDVLDVAALNAKDKLKFGIDGKALGAVVTRVVPGSAADDGDLTRGLRIVRVRVNNLWITTNTAAAWQKAVKGAAPGSTLLLQLRDRDDVSVYKVIVVPEAPATATGTAPIAKPVSLTNDNG